MAPIAPTQAKLPRLRRLSYTRRCEAELALPSILGAAPNLERLDLRLEYGVDQALLKTPTAALKKMTTLDLEVDPDNWEVNRSDLPCPGSSGSGARP